MWIKYPEFAEDDEEQRETESISNEVDLLIL